jgi:hypothetical protein
MSHTFHRKFLRPGVVRGDAGFEVKTKGRDAIRYAEPGKAVTIGADLGIIERGEFKGKWGRMVALSKLRKWDDGTPLEGAERETVQERTREALKFMGIAHITT